MWQRNGYLTIVINVQYLVFLNDTIYTYTHICIDLSYENMSASSTDIYLCTTAKRIYTVFLLVNSPPFFGNGIYDVWDMCLCKYLTVSTQLELCPELFLIENLRKDVVGYRSVDFSRTVLWTLKDDLLRESLHFYIRSSDV